MKTTRPKLATARDPDPADVWIAEVNDKAARAMAAWLKSQVQLQRPIATLTLQQMTALAAVAIQTWIVSASFRVHVAPTPEERERIAALLS